MRNKILAGILFLVFISLAPPLARAADPPLTVDDVTLLLLGGATSEKMGALIEHRGVSFKMNPDLAKKFHDAGADDAVIEALQKAGEKVGTGTRSVSPPPEQKAPPSATPPSDSAPPETKLIRGVKVSEPSSDEVQRIIREFAAKEKVFKHARNNYTYHQINKVQELDPDGNVEGTYEQDWDIVFDDNGKRIERVTYAPPDTLKGLMVTGEDLNSMRNVQPFVLTTDELPDYDVKYLGHVKLDEITAYVFSIRPREIEKGRLYFQGVVWVDDRDLQIVKTEGRTVPEVRAHKGQFNLFPRFTTYREQIDGKFWFPTFTLADDTLYFPERPIHIKEVIKYTEYKQFKAVPTIRVISEMPPGELDGKPKSAPVKDSPLKK